MLDKNLIQLDYIKADYEKINKKLDDINWDFLHSGTDINSITETFYTKLNKVISKEIPARKSFSHSFPPVVQLGIKRKDLSEKGSSLQIQGNQCAARLYWIQKTSCIVY